MDGVPYWAAVPEDCRPPPPPQVAESAAKKIECDLEKTTSYVFGFGDEGAGKCRAEAAAAVQAGLPGAFYTTDKPAELPFPVAGAYGVPDMYNFHPRKWVLGLAKAIPGGGSWIAEGVRATGLTESLSAAVPHTVATTAGAVRARHVVVATHYPIFDRGGFFARLAPVRENAVAGLVDAAAAPKCAYLAADASLSLRSAPSGVAGKRLLLVAGEKYRTGEAADSAERFVRLADWARSHYGMEEILFSWATQDLTPPDGLPFIGRFHPARCDEAAWPIFSLRLSVPPELASLIKHARIFLRCEAVRPPPATRSSSSSITRRVVYYHHAAMQHSRRRTE